MQRLMGRLDTRRRKPSRHRLDALTSTRQKEACTVRSERRNPISMAQDAGQSLKVSCKTRLVGQRGVQAIHASLHHEIESPTLHPKFVTQ
jgi:hypothetical protein